VWNAEKHHDICADNNRVDYWFFYRFRSGPKDYRRRGGKRSVQSQACWMQGMHWGTFGLCCHMSRRKKNLLPWLSLKRLRKTKEIKTLMQCVSIVRCNMVKILTTHMVAGRMRCERFPIISFHRTSREHVCPKTDDA
jgi:hypothetical protein